MPILSAAVCSPSRGLFCWGSIERLRGIYCFCKEKIEGSLLLMTIHPRDAVLAGLLGCPPKLPDRC